MKLFLAKVISTCGGLGYFPVAPGTFVSFIAVLLFVFTPLCRDITTLCIATVLCFAFGTWAGSVMETAYGDDPSIVTIDELVGQWIALAVLPDGLISVVLAFMFFRYFDIAKPGPVDRAQQLPGGWGIMVDDLLAGIFANLSVRAVLALFSLLHVTFPG
ncbi:MAG: phosphatidylglycerophosphatase A [Chlorobiaceae bacterium]|nr:phosphatidylglycerophosphatase A [Chlorobiaceae bacterium]NTW63788.1 phosphatidylglycerophosphatase A [Chlorobiaceae bacterium]